MTSAYRQRKQMNPKKSLGFSLKLGKTKPSSNSSGKTYGLFVPDKKKAEVL